MSLPFSNSPFSKVTYKSFLMSPAKDLNALYFITVVALLYIYLQLHVSCVYVHT